MSGARVAPSRPEAIGSGLPTGFPAGAVAAAGYLALAHVSLGGGWLPTVLALIVAVIRPRLSAALCVAACLIQDAPGLVPDAARVAAVGCGVVHLAAGGWRDLLRSGLWLLMAVGTALLAVLVASGVSLAGWLGWGFEQSASRPWMLVAAADVAMVLVGASIGATTARDRTAAGRVAGAACVGLAVMAVRIACQRWFGPITGFSAVGAASIAAADQLSGNSPNGVVRYVGSMLTPNAMAMAVAFAVLLAWPRLGRAREAAGICAAAVAVAAAVFGGTKSSMLVALAMLVVLPGPIAGLLAIGVTVACLWASPGLREWGAARFRIELAGVEPVPAEASAKPKPIPAATAVAASTSKPVPAPRVEATPTAKPVPVPAPVDVPAPAPAAPPARTMRERALEADQATLRPADAILGMGLSHWPVFYANTVGRPMADPHSAPLSYLWTYGIAGLLAFGTAIVGLLRALRDPAAPRRVALVLLAVLLLRDMFTIPLLIGSTVLSLLMWILLARVLASRGDDGASAGAAA